MTAVHLASCEAFSFVWLTPSSFAPPEKDEQQHRAAAWHPRMHPAGDPEDNQVPGVDSEDAAAH